MTLLIINLKSLTSDVSTIHTDRFEYKLMKLVWLSILVLIIPFIFGA